ncbi:MAG: MFS transporter [Acidobacteria bacterium]|nr:MFS transporter [Acidobacteriota bacterium]
MDQRSSLSDRAVVMLIALLLGATTINYIDRQVLSVLAPTLRDEFSLSNSQYAAILNAFMVTYAVSFPLMGVLLDRLGVGRGLSLAVGWWSLAGMATALSAGPVSMGFFRSLLAVGEAGAWPGFAKSVSIWAPARWRTFAMGVCNSGSSMGAMLAPPLVVFVSKLYGWRGAFVVTGALGLVWVVLFQWFRRSHPQMALEDRGGPARTVADDRLGWRRLIRYRKTWAIFVCRFLADPIWYFYVFWIPEFLARERGLDLTAIGAVAWIPFLVADVSNFTTGYLALRLERAGWGVNRTRKALMLLGAVGSPIGVAAAYTTSLFWTVTFISVAIFLWMSWSVTVHTLAADCFPSQAVGSVYGLGGMGSTLGSVISTWLVGRTLDLTHSYTPVFLGLGLLMPAAFVIGATLLGRIEPVTLDGGSPGRISAAQDPAG